jgi:protein-export membrane protein SecD
VKHTQRNLLILAVVAALIVASIVYIYPPGKKTRLGLDLQGGLEVVYKAALPSGLAPSSDQMSQTISIINRRVNGLGVSEAQVQTQGTDQISVQLPGVKDVQTALNTIGQTAQLQFFNDGTKRVAGPQASLAAAVKQAKQSPLLTDVPAADKAQFDALAKGWTTIDGKPKGKPLDYVVVTAQPGKYGNNETPVYFIYKSQPDMTGAAITSSRQSLDQFNRPNVLIDFNSAGGDQFAKVTKELADAGAIAGVPQQFAIVLDDQMESDPQVDYKTNPNGIEGGKAEITGNFTLSEARDLALVINTGALPVKLTAIESQQVSATLGRDSLHQALIAGLVGLALILIYMVAYYRFLGVIADIALVIYAILLWGVFNFHHFGWTGVTLTLPGIAGMILTIGVAADANVIIFERIKEEVRRGKTVRSAVNSGYARGFRTILDANVLTFLTALVLFIFATAQPKGFALTLMIGVVISMFTAVVATRAMLGLLADFSFFNRASFMGVKAGEIAYEDEGSGADGRSRRRGARPAAAAAGAGSAEF